MGETPASGAGCPVTDEMIDGWERALGWDEEPPKSCGFGIGR